MSLGVAVAEIARPSPYPLSKKKIDKFCVFHASALVFFLGICLTQAMDRLTDFPLTLFVLTLNGLLATYGQVRALRAKASIHFVSFVFCYLFMSAAPIVQIGADLDPVFALDDFAFLASLNAFLFTLIGVYFTHKLPPVETTSTAPPFTRGNYVLVFFMTFVVGVLALALFGGSLFTSREAFGVFISEKFSDGPLSLMVVTILQSLPFFGGAIGMRAALARRNPVWIAAFSMLLLIAAVLNNPMINPRFKIAGLIFFFIDYMFRGKSLKLLALILVIGVGTAPLFNVFRNEFKGANAPVVSQGFFEHTFLSYDYDAFETSTYSLVKVERDGITWGSNVVGSVLFFVPRMLWPTKPEPTSFMVYDTMSRYRFVGTDNLSTPLMAEGYLSFAWFGAIAIGVFYWWGTGRIIKKSWYSSDSLAFLFRCVFAGLVLIFLRGSLTVGMSAVAGSFVSAFIPWYGFRAFKKKPDAAPQLPVA